jgi:hypothetical protein
MLLANLLRDALEDRHTCRKIFTNRNVRFKETESNLKNMQVE